MKKRVHVDVYCLSKNSCPFFYFKYLCAVAVHHVAIVSIGHGLLRKCWPMVKALHGVPSLETMHLLEKIMTFFLIRLTHLSLQLRRRTKSPPTTNTDYHICCCHVLIIDNLFYLCWTSLVFFSILFLDTSRLRAYHQRLSFISECALIA